MANDKGGNENIHAGHRERVRMRFLADQEMKTFSPHEVLEYLLFYGVQRKDTNALAHKLIREFGSLSAVFEADIHDLIAFPELPERAAFLIKSVLPVANAYIKDGRKETTVIDTFSDVLDFCKHSALAINPKDEHVSAIFTDVNGRVRNFAQISKGSASSTTVDIPRLYRLASACRASKVILFHNHPGDTMYPSPNDLITTNVIIITLASLDISVIDHIICGNSGKFFSFYQNSILDSLIELCSSFINTERYKYSLRPLIDDDPAHSVVLGEAETEQIRIEIGKLIDDGKIEARMRDALDKLEAAKRKDRQ